MLKAPNLEGKPTMKSPLIPLINELIHSIALMIIVSKAEETHWILYRIGKLFHFGLGLPIQNPIPPEVHIDT